MTDRVRLWDKCNAIAAGCVAHGMPPTIARVGLLYSVAQHETECGDAWQGEHNWGATTRRSLTPKESAALAAAKIYPVLSPTIARVAAESAANVLLGFGPSSDVAIHTDSRPVVDHTAGAHYPLGHKGGAIASILRHAESPGDPHKVGATKVYFTCFARFADDTAGALYFVGFFRTPAERAALEGRDPQALARAMYAARYYTGFHYGDPEANISDYTRAIAPLYAGAVAALQGWTPGADAPHYTEPSEPPALTGKYLQRALNVGPPVPVPPLVVDGIVGPKTLAALAAYRAAHNGADPQ